ncbi:glycosidase [Lewinella marina]|uniref:Alpha-amlyase n=1 Tax=Neolewinella marina TaxID=438751 RepID=A0A2G0CH58_9BACT|nr:alpha-amylase family glycosyl hydrolase [Neolewinella marina]NJB86216.1 glycosidase [Neolewinella marina]PHK99309.1 alpha-amlyase [Neolewinella marina]
MQHPEWSRNAVLYQINTRQFTPEGTFRAAAGELPRLKQLGVDILWLMPVHPIGEKNRKGELGSPYSIRDYYGVNPEFGTLEDLKDFVSQAHEAGMKVILDWVANHTAWDNALVEQHPEWYARDYKGDFRPTPWWDWSDIIDLDYRQPELRTYMREVMEWWVREVDIDGYRCDVAGYVPVDFWEEVRQSLDQIKPIFMLAEWESRDLHRAAFDATYAWSWHETLHRIAHGKDGVGALFVYYSWNERAWPEDAMRLAFTDNHDKNAWEGTMYEMLGDALEAAIALSFIGEGIPLIHNGQEAGLDKRLAFFSRDPIEWKEHPFAELFARLSALKKEHSALANAPWGATMIRVPNNHESEVLSFVRQDENGKVFAIFNFCGEARTVRFSERLYPGVYTDGITGKQEEISVDEDVALQPWGWRVLLGV